MKAALIIVLLAAGFIGGFGYGRWYGPRTAAAAPQKNGRRILYWVDAMHPAYKSDKPGIAPDCGMKLEPVYADEPSTPAAATVAQPPGTIHIPPEKQQMIGVKFGIAEYTGTGETLRANGKVTVDETRVVRVHSKLEGWIERVHVDFMGSEVRKGDPLLTLYSPEMLASEKEYLLALKARDVMQDGEAMLQASRKRLELWDLGQTQIDELERTGKPVQSIAIYSPATGFVIARNAFPNQRVTPETELYAIADLSHVWIMADLFEADIAKIRMGEKAMVKMPYQNTGAFLAQVDYVQPQVDPQTRTVKVRLGAANAGMKLRPDMFVNVEFSIGGVRQLTVPADAVLNSGAKQTVFVDRGEGYLEPRAVQTGETIGDRTVITGGLQAGERIVTSANFLIDSESQLRTPK